MNQKNFLFFKKRNVLLTVLLNISITVLFTYICFLFSYFCHSIIPVSKTQDIERMLTLLYQYKRQKFDKMNEKRSLGYQSESTEYVTGQINSLTLQLPLRQYYHFICTICCSLIKRFPNDHKSYCSYL